MRIHGRERGRFEPADILRYISLFVVLAALSGCATIMHGGDQKLPVSSDPSGAEVTDNGQKVGSTPTVLMLPRKIPHTVRFQLDGYEDAEVTVRPHISTWFWANCCLFPYTPITMIVDWATGSYNSLWPDKVSVSMRRRQMALLGDEGKTGGGPGKPTLAVADFEAADVSPGNAAIIADLFRNEMVKGGTFDVVEKANMQKVLAEQAFQQSGCTSQECAVKLGKVLNVRFLVVGSFGKLLDSYILNIRVVNVETGKIVYSDSSQGKDVNAVQAAVRDMSAKLSRAL